MDIVPAAFEYSNLSGRPPGPFVTAAGRVVRGIRLVQDEIRPYALAWQAANRIALAATGPLWVVIGDSMSQGIGASRYDRGWVSQLADQLAGDERPHRIVNLSVSGARVQDVLDRQLPALRSLGAEPALVTVLIGSNDIIRRRYRTGLAERYAEMLAELPTGSVVANLPNPHAVAAAVNQEIYRAVEQRGLVLANMRQPRTTSWKGKLAEDHFHPNDVGYADMAAVFAEAVARRLDQAAGDVPIGTDRA